MLFYKSWIINGRCFSVNHKTGIDDALSKLCNNQWQILSFLNASSGLIIWNPIYLKYSYTFLWNLLLVEHFDSLNIRFLYIFLMSCINLVTLSGSGCPLSFILACFLSSAAWLCFSARRFVFSHNTFLKSSSVEAFSSCCLMSMSENKVANVRPVSSAFLVPF